MVSSAYFAFTLTAWRRNSALMCLMIFKQTHSMTLTLASCTDWKNFGPSYDTLVDRIKVSNQNSRPSSPSSKQLMTSVYCHPSGKMISKTGKSTPCTYPLGHNLTPRAILKRNGDYVLTLLLFRIGDWHKNPWAKIQKPDYLKKTTNKEKEKREKSVNRLPV